MMYKLSLIRRSVFLLQEGTVPLGVAAAQPHGCPQPCKRDAVIDPTDTQRVVLPSLGVFFWKCAMSKSSAATARSSATGELCVVQG